MSLARPAVEPPRPSDDAPPAYYTFIRHPGYNDANNTLLKLYAPDGHDTGACGLWAQYALDACGIVVGNRTDGWLSETRDARAAVAPSSLLSKRSYYFHLPIGSNDGGDGPYPIVPTFRDWEFPHDAVPDRWEQALSSSAGPRGQVLAPSQLSTALRTRDKSCRITGCQEGTQVAHICPQSELDWWLSNSMSNYNKRAGTTLNDLCNAFLLRTDLHIAFDASKFVFVPKPDAQRGFQIVTHVMEPSSELEHLYHNRALQPLDVSPATLFSRFAWSIFPLLGTFLSAQVPRRLAGAEYLDQDGFVPAWRCAEIVSKRKPRRPESPTKKRKPSRDNAPVDVDENEDEVEGLPSKKRKLSLDYAGVEQDEGGPEGSSKKRKPSLDDLGMDECKGGPEAHDHNNDCARCRLRKRHKNRPISATPLSSSASAHPQPARNPSTSSPAYPLGTTSNPSPANSLAQTPNSSTVPVSSLAQTWLERERLRSDPHLQWEKKQEWANDVWDGHITLDAHTARDWYEACGVEIVDPGEI